MKVIALSILIFFCVSSIVNADDYIGYRDAEIYDHEWYNGSYKSDIIGIRYGGNQGLKVMFNVPGQDDIESIPRDEGLIDFSDMNKE